MSARFVSPTFGEFAVAAGATMDTLGRFKPLVAAVKNHGISIVPDDWVPWLIYDLGLEEVIPYVRDYRLVLAEGPAWQARRGTPDGIAIGIGWVKSVGTDEPADGRHAWFEFQVRFPEPPEDLAQIRQLDGIIRLSKATEDSLFRLFSPAYDHRPVRMDEHRADSGGWYDGYSGRRRWEGGPLISFGRDETEVCDFTPVMSGGAVLESTGVVSWFESSRYDVDRFETRVPSIFEGAIESDGVSLLDIEDDAWPERWGASWSGPAAPDCFVTLAASDDATLLVSSDDDTWPDDWPFAGAWAAGADPSPVPFPSEPT